MEVLPIPQDAKDIATAIIRSVIGAVDVDGQPIMGYQKLTQIRQEEQYYGRAS